MWLLCDTHFKFVLNYLLKEAYIVAWNKQVPFALNFGVGGNIKEYKITSLSHFRDKEIKTCPKSLSPLLAELAREPMLSPSTFREGSLCIRLDSPVLTLNISQFYFFIQQMFTEHLLCVRCWDSQRWKYKGFLKELSAL